MDGAQARGRDPPFGVARGARGTNPSPLAFNPPMSRLEREGRAEAEGRPQVERPSVQILVVVAVNQAATNCLMAEVVVRVPCQHRLDMG